MTTRVAIADQARSDERRYVRLPLSSESGSPQSVLTLRRAGDMSLSTPPNPARGAVLRELRVDERRTFGLTQVHSRDVLVAERLGPGIHEGDGLIASSPDSVLTVTVADCLPIFLYDPQSSVFALVHSGWRGTGIAGVALRVMAELAGTRAADVKALIGPGIGPCCYNVPHDRAELFRATWGESSVTEHDGAEYLDLARTNELVLEREGVEQMTIVADCTCCSPFLGSFRREGASGYTRMLALIGHFE